jgi:hypothetical protein
MWISYCISMENLPITLMVHIYSSTIWKCGFMSSCPLYTGYIYMHYSLMGKMLPSIDSDLLYRVAL